MFFGESKKLQFGLINTVNTRGLGTESQILESIFANYFPNIDFKVYKLKSNRKAKVFDEEWHKSFLFKRWLRKQDYVMTIENFMPNLASYCRDLGIKTIWRPNQEWINPKYAQSDFEKVDVIMAPQKACSDFLVNKFKLQNVILNPWITNLGVVEKNFKSSEQTTFIFNAGRGGIGERRNTQLVLSAFEKILPYRPDIQFIFKSQSKYDVSAFKKFNNMRCIFKNESYQKNLDYYRQADFSLAPSKWEGVGFALLESLYSGTPVLTVDAPPMNEWVEHKRTGYLVPSEFPDVDVPIALDGSNLDGVNWVLAAHCDVAELIKGVLWLADNKVEFYRQFNEYNENILSQRKSNFLKTFSELLNTKEAS